MKIPRLLQLLAALLLVFPAPSSATQVSGLTAIFRPFLDEDGREKVAIRSFLQDGGGAFLAVDPVTLRTAVVSAGNLRFRDSAPAASPYLRALARYNAPSARIQNEGIRHAERNVAGVFLTVDMCPSVREMEHLFFRQLAERGAASGKPLPVGIAVTGAWLDRHPSETEMLLRMHREGKLEITWINHSDSHPYIPGVALEHNFLLKEGVDFRREVLETERKLLEKGGVPSPFFRYPGLISDAKLAAGLKELGLIPLGSDAWLAKGEHPAAGSIILVHGNGNEHPGIDRFFELMQKKSDLRFLPLPELFDSAKRAM